MNELNSYGIGIGRDVAGGITVTSSGELLAAGHARQPGSIYHSSIDPDTEQITAVSWYNETLAYTIAGPIVHTAQQYAIIPIIARDRLTEAYQHNALLWVKPDGQIHLAKRITNINNPLTLRNTRIEGNTLHITAQQENGRCVYLGVNINTGQINQKHRFPAGFVADNTVRDHDQNLVTTGTYNYQDIAVAAIIDHPTQQMRFYPFINSEVIDVLTQFTPFKHINEHSDLIATHTQLTPFNHANERGYVLTTVILSTVTGPPYNFYLYTLKLNRAWVIQPGTNRIHALDDALQHNAGESFTLHVDVSQATNQASITTSLTLQRASQAQPISVLAKITNDGRYEWQLLDRSRRDKHLYAVRQLSNTGYVATSIDGTYAAINQFDPNSGSTASACNQQVKTDNTQFVLPVSEQFDSISLAAPGFTLLDVDYTDGQLITQPNPFDNCLAPPPTAEPTTSAPSLTFTQAPTRLLTNIFTTLAATATVTLAPSSAPSNQPSGLITTIPPTDQPSGLVTTLSPTDYHSDWATTLPPHLPGSNNLQWLWLLLLVPIIIGLIYRYRNSINTSSPQLLLNHSNPRHRLSVYSVNDAQIELSSSASGSNVDGFDSDIETGPHQPHQDTPFKLRPNPTHAHTLLPVVHPHQNIYNTFIVTSLFIIWHAATSNNQHNQAAWNKMIQRFPNLKSFADELTQQSQEQQLLTQHGFKCTTDWQQVTIVYLINPDRRSQTIGAVSILTTQEPYTSLIEKHRDQLEPVISQLHTEIGTCTSLIESYREYLQHLATEWNVRTHQLQRTFLETHSREQQGFTNFQQALLDETSDETKIATFHQVLYEVYIQKKHNEVALVCFLLDHPTISNFLPRNLTRYLTINAQELSSKRSLEIVCENHDFFSAPLSQRAQELGNPRVLQQLLTLLQTNQQSLNTASQASQLFFPNRPTEQVLQTAIDNFLAGTKNHLRDLLEKSAELRQHFENNFPKLIQRWCNQKLLEIFQGSLFQLTPFNANLTLSDAGEYSWYPDQFLGCLETNNLLGNFQHAIRQLHQNDPQALDNFIQLNWTKLQLFFRQPSRFLAVQEKYQQLTTEHAPTTDTNSVQIATIICGNTTAFSSDIRSNQAYKKWLLTPQRKWYGLFLLALGRDKKLDTYYSLLGSNRENTRQLSQFLAGLSVQNNAPYKCLEQSQLFTQLSAAYTADHAQTTAPTARIY